MVASSLTERQAQLKFRGKIIVWLAVAILVGVSALLWYVSKLEKTLVWSDSSCAPIGLVGEGLGLSLKVDCGGKIFQILSQQLALSYAINPGPINCSGYANNSVKCDQRPFK